ncbi:MAG: hypothetical protein AAGB00_01815 [Planctomycetota bacterium]
MNANQLLRIMSESPFPRLEVRLNNGDNVVIDQPYLVSIDKGEPSFAVHEEDTTRHIAYRNVAQIVTLPHDEP